MTDLLAAQRHHRIDVGSAARGDLYQRVRITGAISSATFAPFFVSSAVKRFWVLLASFGIRG